MDNTLNIGDVYKLTRRHESGAWFVQIEDIDGTTVHTRTGQIFDGEFLPKTFSRGSHPVRHISVSKNGLALFQFNQEIPVMAKKEDAQVKELTYELDDDVQPNRPLTAEEQIAAIRKAADDKIQAAKDKEAAKEQAKKDKEEAKKKKDEEKAQEKLKKANDKRIEKLTAAAEKAGVTVTDACLQYSNSRTKDPIELTDVEAEQAIAGLKETAKDKVKADKLALISNLTAEEEKELRKFEGQIEKFLPTFQQAAFQIGAALQQISAKRLYRASHKTFADYVSERFDLSRPHAYSVMAAAETFKALTSGVDFKAKDMPSITAAEAITRGVKGLLKSANVTEDAEVEAISQQLARNVYNLAVQNAPIDKDGKPILSPGHLASVFSVLNEVARTGVVEMDGEHIDVNLAAASIDEMITNESAERVKRAKQYLADQINTAHDAVKEAKGSKLDAALNSAAGNGAMIMDGVIPKLTVICSVHGKVELSESSDVDVKLGCDCIFVSTPEGYLFDKNLTKQVSPPLPTAPTQPAVEVDVPLPDDDDDVIDVDPDDYDDYDGDDDDDGE